MIGQFKEKLPWSEKGSSDEPTTLEEQQEKLSDEAKDSQKNESSSVISEKEHDAIYNINEDLSTMSTSDGVEINDDDVLALLLPDKEDAPALTLRMWVIAIVLSAVVSGVDSFFTMRFPTISIGAIVILIVAYPLGNLWYFIVPSWNVPLPYGLDFNLNPGKFNSKEHACIFFFSNLVTSEGLVNNLVIEQRKFFNVNIGIGRTILYNFSCYLTAYGLCGLSRDILVTPQDRVWPGILGYVGLFKSLYAKDNPPVEGWKISRYSFFAIIFCCSFVWYWLPDLLMPFLSTLGGWITWIRPNSAALSQVFGVKTGLGLFPLTLDWTQITSISNPLITPFSAICCMFGSFVLWVWVIMPGLYYQNHWQTAHMPIMTNSIYDYQGMPYNASKVVNKSWSLDLQKFRKYSPVILPIAFLINLALGMAVFAALVMNFALMFHSEVIVPIRDRKNHRDLHNEVMSKYKTLHWGFYLACVIIGLALGFAFSEGFSNSPIRAGGYIVSVVMGAVLYLPTSLIESRTNAQISLAPFFEIVSSFWFRGKPFTLLYFYSFGFATIQHAMHASQGAKLGHYMRVPPRSVMIVLFVASIWASLVTPAVAGYIVEHFHDVCTPNAKNNMTCRKVKTQFNTHLVWGLFGDHIFKAGGRYSWVLYFFLVGAVASLVHFLLVKFLKGRWQKWISKVNPILLFSGAANIPSVTGFNFSTWFAVACFFNYFLHRKHTAWWRKYNMILAVGLDCGVAIAAILIYFCVVYTGASEKIQWWGTEVSSKGCDSMGCPFKSGPMKRPSGF